jgi:hypothetical protein
LVDNHNQRGAHFPGRPDGSIEDNVAGYSLSQIEANVLPGCHNFNTLLDELKSHKPSGVTDDQLDQLFSNF